MQDFAVTYVTSANKLVTYGNWYDYDIACDRARDVSDRYSTPTVVRRVIAGIVAKHEQPVVARYVNGVEIFADGLYLQALHYGDGSEYAARMDDLKGRKPLPPRFSRPFVCMECGNGMTTAEAEAMECPQCGGSDYDVG